MLRLRGTCPRPGWNRATLRKVRTSSLVLSAAVLCVAIRAAAAVQTAPPTPPVASTPDVTTLGPQVGEKVPDFALPDHRGRRHTLSSLMGPKGLVLVFSRSADW
jgi:cytochrome oxidase Cu insertion factor (SCO1/SenC/PrrC family)